jgi:hypothetical protein
MFGDVNVRRRVEGLAFREAKDDDCHCRETQNQDLRLHRTPPLGAQ